MLGNSKLCLDQSYCISDPDLHLQGLIASMFHPASFFIGIRYAKASRSNHFIAFINLVSVTGIALGLMALITVISVMNGFEGQLKQRILGIVPHMVVDTREQSEQIPAIGQIEQVLAITPLIEGEGVVQSPRGLQGVMFQGIDPNTMEQHSEIARNMLYGELTDLKAGEYGLVIGRALSLKLGLRAGDKARVIAAGASIYTPFGRMPSQRLYTVVGIYDVGSELDDKVILMHMADSSRLMRQKVENLSKTRLFLEDAFEYQEVEQQISLPTDNWRLRQGPLFDAVKMEKNMMGLMLLLIISVAAFNIVSALVMVVTEKKGDIAILRTQGMNSKDIVRIFMFNGLYNGLKGTFWGLLGGLLLVSQLNLILELLGAPIMLGDNGKHLPVDVQWQQIGFLVLFSLLLTFVASLYPAYRALKIEPAQALKYE